MLPGIPILVIGLVVTFGTYSRAAHGGSYVIAWGAIAYGAYRIWLAYDDGEGPFGTDDQAVVSSSPPRHVALRNECLAQAAEYRRDADFEAEANCYRRLIYNDIMTKWSVGQLASVYRVMGKIEEAAICVELASKTSTWWREHGVRIRQSLIPTDPA